METATQLTDNITAMLRRGNLHMKEWIYSYKSCSEGKGDKAVDVTCVDVHSEKVLGMKWLVEGVCLILK